MVALLILPGPAGSTVPSGAGPIGSGIRTTLSGGSTTNATGDWPTYEYDLQRTGDASASAELNYSTLSELRAAWTASAYGTVSGSLAVASGFVYAGSWNGHLYEFNATSGQEVWNLTLTTPHVAGYGSTYGACWREGGIPSTPTVTVSRAGGVSYNTVFVTAGTGLYSINATRAAYQPGQAINWFTNLTNYSDVPNAGRDWGYHYLWSSPLIYNGSAYAGVAETCDARSVQAQLFQIPLAGSGPYHAPAHIFDVTGASGTAPDVAGGIWSTPSVDPVTNLLWVSTGNENSTWSGSWSQYYTRSILALNASNVSELVGSAQVGSSGTDEDFGAGPTLFHDAAGRSLVGAINKDGIFYAYDASHFGSGTCFPGLPSPCLLPAWTQSTGSYGVSLISIAPSAFGGGKLFVPSGPSGNGSWDGVVSALLPSNGTIEWQQPIGGPSGGYVPLAGLTYANGLLIDAANGFDQGRADGNGIVEIRNASDGAVVWQRLLNQSIDGEVVASGDLVLFGTGSGSNTTGFVTAYRITPPTPPPPKLLLASQPSVDLGQSVNFTANVSSAFGPGAFRWNASSGLGCLSSSNRLLSCHPSATGATYSVSFVATGANITSAQAALTNFVVHRLPRVFAPSPSATSVDVNQTILFRATTFGGSGGGTFLWTNLSTALGCTPSSNSTLRCSPNSVGTGFGVSVSWTDSNGIASPSVPSAAVSVFASPSVFPPAPSSPLADLGQSVVFTASTTGGTGGAVFNWSATSPALRCAPSAGPRLACVANASASGVTVAVRWTDAAGQSSAWVASQPLEVDEDPVSGPPIASVPRADVGEWIVFQANVSGGSGGGRYDWSGFGPSLGCLNSTSALLDCRPTLPGSYLVSLNWTDSAGESSGVGSATTVSVSGDPFIAPLSASRTSADLGQSIVLSTEVSGGAGGYRYHWSVPDGLGCPLVDAPSIVCWPTASGSSYVAWVTVSDANGISTDVVTSAQLSVFDPPSVTTPTATRPSADAGQTVRFATKVGGGSGGLDYTWSGLPGACSATNGSSPLCVVSGAALYRVSITVADSNGAVTSAGNDLPFRVFDAPSAGPAEEPRSAVDVGQSLGFSISASGGTGNFSYFWSGIPSNCSDRRGSAVTCTPTTPGNWTPVVLVRDSNGWLDFVRLSVPLVVYDDPQVALTSPGLGVADLGQTLRLSALPSGGLGPFSYRWEGLPDGCVATSTATPSCRPSAVGSFGVVVVVTDADGFTAQSPSLAVVIDPAPTAAALSTTLVPLAGAEVGFLASGSGGGGAFDYNWEFGDGARASGASATHAFRHPGTYRVTVTATDGNGANATANLTLQVQATGSEGLFGTAMPPALGAGIALAGLLALGIILWTVRRGTRRVARTRPVRPREPRAVAPTRDAGPASDLP